MTSRWFVLSLLLAGSAGCTVDIGPAQGPRIRVVSDISRTDTIDAAPTQPIVIEITDSTGRPAFVGVTAFGIPAQTSSEQPGMFVYDEAGNPTVGLTVRGDGRATFHVIFGRRAGQAGVVISAPDLRLTDTLLFTVNPGAATHLALIPAFPVVVLGASYQQGALVLDRADNDLNRSSAVTFSGLNTGITVSSSGLVRGTEYARAGIRATYLQISETGLVSVVPAGRLATVITLGTFGQPNETSVTVLGMDGSPARRYSTPPLDASDAVWNADATRIYYVGTPRASNQPQRIYSLRVADGAFSPLIADTVSALVGEKLSSPAVSRDGAWVYFIRLIGFTTTGEVWRVHPDGTGLTPLLTNHVFRASLAPSPDGTRLAYVESAGGAATENEIKILDIQSGNTLTIAGTGAGEIRWSPTANRIAIKGDGVLYVMNADGSGLTQIGAYDSFFTGLDWSPDGRWVLANLTGIPTIIDPATGLELPLNIVGVGDSWSPQ